MNLRYRQWEFKDLMAISVMEREIFPTTAWTYQMLADAFQSGKFYGICCEQDGEIIGYGGVTLGYDDAEIDNIGVSEFYRGEGIGRVILGMLVKFVKEKGKKKLYLEVRVSNTPAWLLYLRAGFKGVYARPRYYPDGEDAVVMVKEL